MRKTCRISDHYGIGRHILSNYGICSNHRSGPYMQIAFKRSNHRSPAANRDLVPNHKSGSRARAPRDGKGHTMPHHHITTHDHVGMNRHAAPEMTKHEPRTYDGLWRKYRLVKQIHEGL
ncbi:hypothetical protein CH262_20370 [Rhodococcus sp. 05-2255-1e]|nr:hypothetical protein CH262_20370 [Rhodococcus sp. 05-2255-1e]